MNAALLQLVMQDVRAEIARAEAKHPPETRPFPRDPLRRTALVVEEAGEALREALDLTRLPRPLDAGSVDEPGRLLWPPEAAAVRGRLRDELEQCAAMALYVLMEMRKEDHIVIERRKPDPPLDMRALGDAELYRGDV